MKYLIILCLIIASGCSAKTFSVGEVSHQVVSCTNTDDCKTKMNKTCPEGGVLHKVSPSITVEYSCR